MRSNLPQHIAVIPDGNRRWAHMKGLPTLEGHRAGADRMHQVVDNLIQLGIKYLTIWGFSSDNWKRSQDEVATIFQLTQEWINKETPWLNDEGVKLRHIGRLWELPETLQAAITRAIELTKANTGMTLNLAFNYSGRAEILDAVYRLCLKALDCDLSADEIEVIFSRYLYTDGIPDIDLVIRTADELRISNFMLWQTAYSEYYFTPVFWPDFDRLELEKALAAYRQRDRRFGGG